MSCLLVLGRVSYERVSVYTCCKGFIIGVCCQDHTAVLGSDRQLDVIVGCVRVSVGERVAAVSEEGCAT